MIEDILALSRKILSEYGNDKYVQLTGDRRLENVPGEILKLWNGDGTHCLSLCNLMSYVIMAKNGSYDPGKLYLEINNLKQDLEESFRRLHPINF